MSSPTLKLNSGYEMPQVGLGLWKVDPEVCADTVYNAIKNGYRLFDGACDYGNEKEAGDGVRRAIQDGLVKREELFIVSKLWNSFHDKDKVVPACKKSLSDWGVDYFDLYLIHFPIAIEYVDPSVRYPPGWANAEGKTVAARAPLQGTWEAMETIADQGLARSIGVSNYNGGLLLDLFRYARIMPAVLQIEHHPYLVQQPLLDLCKANGITVTGYSSFGPQSFRDLAAAGIDMKIAHDIGLLFENSTITSIAQKHGKTPAQVLLRWATQRGLAVIPKSSSPERLKQNLDVTAFDLSEEEIKTISALDKGLRFNDPLNYGINLPCFA